MGERRRVDGEPAYVLHAYPFRETSLIVEVFSRHHGRVALMARGARRPRSALRGLLMAFQPLELGWAGKGEVMTLMKAEWQGGQAILQGEALFCGYYLNELLLNLLPREDPHEALFDHYAHTLLQFASGVDQAALRLFEKALLQELGYGLTLDRDNAGVPLAREARYVYEVEQGPVAAPPGQTDSPWCVHGQTLLDLGARNLDNVTTLAESKQLMRALINHYLAGHELTTRRIFRDLQEL